MLAFWSDKRESSNRYGIHSTGQKGAVVNLKQRKRSKRCLIERLRIVDGVEEWIRQIVKLLQWTQSQ